MPFLNSVISWFTTKRMYQIELFKKFPIDVQRDTLIELINSAKDTEYGKKYNFEKLLISKGQIFSNFIQNVPLVNYETFKEEIDKVRNGENNVIWNTEIQWFAKSSGTTSDKSKFIPVTTEILENCHFRGGKDILVINNFNFPENNFFKGRALAIGGSQQINSFENDIFYGDLSAVLMKNLPLWIDIIRVPNKSIALMEEWEEKIEKIAQSTINKNITNISGVPSWTLVLLKRILEITGKSSIDQVWQNLELFVHGGVSFIPYREQFNNIIKNPNMQYMETYNASEGFFAIQDDLNSDDMLLMLDYNIFYEFIPMDSFCETDSKTVLLDEVQIDKNYALVITTSGGLWRYIIGDTVKFTSKYPFKIKITGRTKQFINAFGEELIVDNAEKALKIACERTNSEIREYTAAPIYMSETKNGCHQWLIEFSKPPQSVDYFADVLDTILKTLNSDYEAKRYKDISLSPPQIIIAKKDLFYKWLKINNKLGGQNKVPRLVNERKHIDQLLLLNSKSDV